MEWWNGGIMGKCIMSNNKVQMTNEGKIDQNVKGITESLDAGSPVATSHKTNIT